MLRFRHRTHDGIIEATAESPAELDAYDLAIPVEPPEVWGAGVTYQRLRCVPAAPAIAAMTARL